MPWPTTCSTCGGTRATAICWRTTAIDCRRDEAIPKLVGWKGEGVLPKTPTARPGEGTRRTSNTEHQHRTSNIERGLRLRVQCWTLDVRCWMFGPGMVRVSALFSSFLAKPGEAPAEPPWSRLRLGRSLALPACNRAWL